MVAIFKYDYAKLPTVGDAIIINGKQLFIDDYIIEQLNGRENPAPADQTYRQSVTCYR